MRPSLLEVRMLDDGVSIIDVDAGCTEASCISSHHTIRSSLPEGDL